MADAFTPGPVPAAAAAVGRGGGAYCVHQHSRRSSFI